MKEECKKEDGRFIDIVDRIVMDAYSDGVSVLHHQYADRIDVRGRLSVYGYVDDGKYYLNALGVEYAMKGCSAGIENRLRLEREDGQLEREERRLNMECSRQSIKDARCSKRISILSFIVALASAIVSFLSLLFGSYG